MNINDAKYAAINATNLSIGDEYHDWLKANGGTGSSTVDLELSMLLSKGVTEAPLNDMWLELLTTLAIPGEALQDKLRAFWAGGGTIP